MEEGARELAARQWVEEFMGEKINGTLQEGLKSGVVLCKILNKIQPNIVARVNKMNQAFFQMENIKNAVTAMRVLGLQESGLFNTVDLYEGTNMKAVAHSILELAALAKSKGACVCILNTKSLGGGVGFVDASSSSRSHRILGYERVQ